MCTVILHRKINHYLRGTQAKISNQKWPRFAPKLAVHRPKYDVLDHIFILKTVPKLVHVCTYIVILKNSIKTGTCNSLDYQKWPRFAPKLAVHRPKFWGKIARILVQRLLVRSGLPTKITVFGQVMQLTLTPSVHYLVGQI